MFLTEEQIKKIGKALTKTMILINNNQFSFLEELTGTSAFSSNLQYDSLYPSATEDMASYYREFKKTGSFLTVGASGEHVINAINSGATKIDVYDSNLLCEYALSLRLAAIKALSYEEYLTYYQTFDSDLFIKLADYLDNEAHAYWTTLYYNLSLHGNPSNILSHLLFVYKRLDKNLVKKINPYLDPKNFQNLKKKIASANITFIPSDLYSLPKHITNQTYDVINCSNIYEYLNFYPNVTLEKAKQYRNFIINELYPHLNNSGTILVSYLYAWSDKLKKDFDKMYKETNGHIVKTGAISLAEYPYYLNGLTSQNLAYSYLFDAFANDPLEKIPTNHVQFGQSKDMSHDLALILRKK